MTVSPALLSTPAALPVKPVPENDGLLDASEIATLKLNAKEVSLMMGVKKAIIGPADIRSEGRLAPTFSEALEE